MELALDILPQVLVDGIVLGFMYALIALGYTMVYGVLEFINFAHSEIFVLGAFVGVEVLLLLESAGHLATLHTAFVLLLVILSGMLLSGLAAMALERVAYRPLQGSPRLVALISAIGASFFLQDALRFFESLWRNTFYLTYPTMDVLDQTVPLGLNVVVPVKSLLVIVTALVSLAALHLFINRTRLGTAIRAVAQDPDTASLMGIPVTRVIALTFFVGGAMGGLAGVLFGLHYSLVNPYSGFFPDLAARDNVTGTSSDRGLSWHRFCNRLAARSSQASSCSSSSSRWQARSPASSSSAIRRTGGSSCAGCTSSAG